MASTFLAPFYWSSESLCTNLFVNLIFQGVSLKMMKDLNSTSSEGALDRFSLLIVLIPLELDLN